MPTVLLLPDSALLVPGVGGSHADPLAEARATVVGALRGVRRGGSTTVIARGRATRELGGPFGDGLAAAGVLGAPASAAPSSTRTGRVASGPMATDPLTGHRPGRTEPGPDSLDRAAGPRAVPAVGAAAALALLALAGHDPDAATVREIGTTPGHPGELADLTLVVGSLSARHGPDAPLPDDPAALAVDIALLTALGVGPRALAQVLDDLDPPSAARLAITGYGPWRALLDMLTGALDVDATLLWSGTPGGAQHAVARWELTR